MRVIPPINTEGFTIDAAMLTASGAAEPGPGEVAYDAGHTYGVAEVCYLAATHRIYESRVASNVGNDPALATIDTPSEHWQDIGPTNRWAMFDTLRSTGTVMTSPAVVEITTGRRIDSVGVAGMANVDRARVELYRGAEQVYDSGTVNLRTRHPTSYYQYFFNHFDFLEDFARFNLPPYTDGTIRLTFTRDAGGEVSVGAVLVGMSQDIGRALHGADDDATNFSRIDRSFDGSAQIVRRRNVPRNTIQLVLPKSEVARVRQLRDNLNAIPAMYIGIESDGDGYYSSLFKLGIYKQWRLTLGSFNYATLSVEIEEL